MPETNTSLQLITSSENVSGLVQSVKNAPIMKEEDAQFLMEHTEHLGMVLDKSFMWRTDAQKRSILTDVDFPTLHSKFHQAMLEQKVQFEQTMYLVRDFEQLKLDIQLMECDLEELEADTSKSDKRKKIEGDKIRLDMSYKRFELNQMQVQMNYRMAEIKGWQKIEEEIMDKLHEAGMSDEDIWNKEEGEAQFLFLLALNKLTVAIRTNDTDGLKAVIPLALFVYQEAERNGKLNVYRSECNETQLEMVNWIANYIKNYK